MTTTEPTASGPSLGVAVGGGDAGGVGRDDPGGDGDGDAAGMPHDATMTVTTSRVGNLARIVDLPGRLLGCGRTGNETMGLASVGRYGRSS